MDATTTMAILFVITVVTGMYACGELLVRWVLRCKRQREAILPPPFQDERDSIEMFRRLNS